MAANAGAEAANWESHFAYAHGERERYHKDKQQFDDGLHRMKANVRFGSKADILLRLRSRQRLVRKSLQPPRV